MQNKVVENTIAVVIPSYNSSETINDCIYSVLNQTHKVNEIIIVNDGSTDNTLEILESIKNKEKSYFIKILNQKNKGIGAARNLGLQNCNSEFVAFLDSDDYWFSNKIEICLEELSKKNDLDIVYHDEILIKNNKSKLIEFGRILEPKPNNFVFFRNNLSPSSVIVRFALLKKIGFFSEDMKFNSAEDYDLWIRLSYNNFNYKYINSPLGKYVVVNNSITNNRLYHFNSVINVLLYHFKNFKISDKLKKSFINKQKFIFLMKELKIALINLNVYRISYNILAITKIILLSNLYFYRFLFNDKNFIKKIQIKDEI